MHPPMDAMLPAGGHQEVSTSQPELNCGSVISAGPSCGNQPTLASQAGWRSARVLFGSSLGEVRPVRCTKT